TVGGAWRVPGRTDGSFTHPDPGTRSAHTRKWKKHLLEWTRSALPVRKLCPTEVVGRSVGRLGPADDGCHHLGLPVVGAVRVPPVVGGEQGVFTSGAQAPRRPSRGSRNPRKYNSSTTGAANPSTS